MTDSRRRPLDDVQPNAPTSDLRPGDRRRRSSTRLTDDIVAALKTVYDPEIPFDIYELGLIYKVDIDDRPACRRRHDPDGAGLPGGRRDAGLGRDGGRRGAGRRRAPRSTMVFDPPWDQSRMSDEARVALDMF